MNQWFLEFEGFELSRGFVFKEVSIRSADNQVSKQFFIRSPCGFSKLSDSDKKIVRWCEKYYHKINWRSGNISFESTEKILKNVLNNSSKVFTKGFSKVKVLQSTKIPGIFENIEDNKEIPTVANFKKNYPELLNLYKGCQLPFHKDQVHCADLKSFVLAAHISNYESLFKEECLVFETDSEMQGIQEEDNH
jgi:hypothetical protein